MAVPHSVSFNVVIMLVDVPFALMVLVPLMVPLMVPLLLMMVCIPAYRIVNLKYTCRMEFFSLVVCNCVSCCFGVSLSCFH